MATSDAGERAWNPTGITPLGAPKPKPTVDLRWRPIRGAPTLVGTREEKSWNAISQQCMNSRMPGYGGFIPSAKAESAFARTQAAIGHCSERAQNHQRELRAMHASRSGISARSGSAARSGAGSRASSPGAATPTSSACAVTLRPENLDAVTRYGLPPGGPPDDHPLGKSMSKMVRNHWVPTIPGYGGYIPGKHAENITGAGITDTCRLAGRAIAERGPGPAERRSITMHEDDVQRGRVAEHFHAAGEDGEERQRLAQHIRDHCAKQIPGYQGHVPKIFGESIYGSTACAANRVAADIAEDRIFNPEDEHTLCAKVQRPSKRTLRL